MEADTPPSGLAKKDTFSGPKFIHSEASPQDQRVTVRRKKKASAAGGVWGWERGWQGR